MLSVMLLWSGVLFPASSPVAASLSFCEVLVRVMFCRCVYFEEGTYGFLSQSVRIEIFKRRTDFIVGD